MTRVAVVFIAIAAVALSCPRVWAEEGQPATETKAAEPGAAKPSADFDWREFSKTTPPPKHYVGGDLWTRSTLSGDWGGLRNDLAEKGFTLDYSYNQTLQGNLGGGRKFRWPSQGSSDLTLNFDTGKMGLYPGGFLKIHAENRFGNSINGLTGALMPVNTDSLYPVPEEDTTTLSEVVYVQMLSPQFGVIMGKIQPREDNVFASNENTQFMNSAFVFNAAAATTVPLDALGAGIIVMPTEWLTVTALVLDSEGSAGVSGFDTAFHGGTAILNKYDFKIKPFGQVGHQRIAWTWSDKSRFELDQRLITPAEVARLQQLRAILQGPARFPRLRELLLQRYGSALRSRMREYGRIRAQEFLAGLPDRATRQSSDWSILYDFDQFLYTVPGHEGRGFGVFGRIGITSGEVNPIQDFYSIGVGGKGLCSCRPYDSFGVGYYYLGSSTGMSRLLSRFIEDEQGVEAYYSIAVTPWMCLTPSIQVIDPSIRGIDTTTVFGIRMQMSF